MVQGDKLEDAIDLIVSRLTLKALQASKEAQVLSGSQLRPQCVTRKNNKQQL